VSGKRSQAPLVPADSWECPCGRAPAKPGSTTTPVRTVVSIREPACPFCGAGYKDEFRIPREQSP